MLYHEVRLLKGLCMFYMLGKYTEQIYIEIYIKQNIKMYKEMRSERWLDSMGIMSSLFRHIDVTWTPVLSALQNQHTTLLPAHGERFPKSF